MRNRIHVRTAEVLTGDLGAPLPELPETISFRPGNRCRRLRTTPDYGEGLEKCSVPSGIRTRATGEGRRETAEKRPSQSPGAPPSSPPNPPIPGRESDSQAIARSPRAATLADLGRRKAEAFAAGDIALRASSTRLKVVSSA